MSQHKLRAELDQLRLRVDTILQAVRALADDISRLQEEFDDSAATSRKETA